MHSDPAGAQTYLPALGIRFRRTMRLKESETQPSSRADRRRLLDPCICPGDDVPGERDRRGGDAPVRRGVERLTFGIAEGEEPVCLLVAFGIDQRKEANQRAA